MCAAAIREVKACCTNISQDAKATCARTIRKAETTCMKCARALQQADRDSMEGLEREAIEEEEGDCQSFLTACGAALQICPQEPKGTNVPSPITNGEHVFGHPLGHSTRCPLPWKNLPL